MTVSNFIPTHPLGVKPLGNLYLSSSPNAKNNAGSLAILADETLMLLLEHLDSTSLANLGATCQYLFAFSNSDELWKQLFLQSPKRTASHMEWIGTWRSLLRRCSEEPKRLQPPSCSNVFSDVLHRPFLCSHIDLAKYTSNIPARNQIARMETMSYGEFSSKWGQKPFVLTNYVKDWRAMKEWTIDSLLEKYHDVVFRAECVDWDLESYVKYMKNTGDESPLYLFDKKFAEKMNVTVGPESTDMYGRPEVFGPDLFEVLGTERPAHRWLIIGPARSGSTFHKDPNATSAWNAVVQGSKYWIMFPPSVDVPGVYVSEDSSEVTSPLSIAEWLIEFHTEARQKPECIEGICKAGEILHVPSGWWHLVVNLEDGIALTQNFVPRTNNLHHLVEALSFLKDKADQVSGFEDEVTNPYDLFVERLHEKFPDMLEEGVVLYEKKQAGKKRKWDDVVAVKDEQSQQSGFSFGFVIDDEESEEEES
ncbi:hypothetical protein TD95_004764 [Thielaviopsis punctulata]|uniref:Uncharacterized protein n=1 Tax=Thielaviopsis punctulata TaxID=72032 RepID=A0A0F4ZIT0_9PEZI|nr:hypothetical protein TD95_004764 [Thielaviopsis punctulata]